MAGHAKAKSNPLKIENNNNLYLLIPLIMCGKTINILSIEEYKMLLQLNKLKRRALLLEIGIEKKGL